MNFAGLPTSFSSTSHRIFVGELLEGRGDGGDAIGDPSSSLCMFHFPDFNIHNPPIPQPLPKVPAETREAVEETAFEEVADAEVGEGAEVGRESVVCALVRVHLA